MPDLSERMKKVNDMKKTGMNTFLVLLVCCLVLALPSNAAQNGKIAFCLYATGSCQISVMNADGSGVTGLGHYGSSPAWSPDGSKKEGLQ
jgi:hypothetical protein